MDIFEVSIDDMRLIDLLHESNAYAVAHSPAGKDYAIKPDAPDVANMRYWIALEGESACGCIGLKPLAADHGEIKSMHVREGYRGKGAAVALLERLMGAAKSSGVTRISLETGSSPGYASSRRFYNRMGFAHCPVFGDYLDDGVSYCMTRWI